MKKRIGILIINLTSFSILSYVFISMLLIKQNIDLILIYALSCFFLFLWIIGSFSKKFFHLLYKTFKKPMEKSWTLELLAKEIAPEDKAFETFQIFMQVCPYISFLFLSAGILIIYLL